MQRALVLLLSGCVLRDDTVTITLKDPARVSVHAPGAEILADGSARGDIPATAFVREPSTDAWITRDDARLDAWCNACREWKRRTILDSPVLVLAGTPDQLVRVSDGQLHARYVFEDAGARGRHGWMLAPRFALDLVTPLANVVSVRGESRISDRNGGPPAEQRRSEIGAMIFGGVYATGGLALAGFGEQRDASTAVAVGALMAIVGTVIVGGALWEYRACSREPPCRMRRAR